MILPLFLIILFFIFVFYAVSVMVKRGHDLFALAFFGLYIYTVFAQIGYAFYPELSILIGAYFGPDLFYKYWAFMFFSFVFAFLLYKKTFAVHNNKQVFRLVQSSNKYGILFFFLIVLLLYTVLNIYFYLNRGLFGWGGGQPMGSQWFVIGFRIFTICTLILFTLFRNKSNKSKVRKLSFFLFFISIFFFIKIAIAAGTRSDIIYFFIAVVFYELSPFNSAVKYQKMKIFILSLSAVFITSLLMVLLSLRTQTSNVNFSSFLNYESNNTELTDVSISSKILMQDYYGPSHTLFISMHYDIIDPIEVFKSNFFNSLIMFKYPYLSNTIVEKVGSISERGAGWSYHLFVEGFNALGWLGIFYNAIFWNLGMGLWTILTHSDKIEYNKAMLSILALIIVMTMRGQTCAFIQFYWMIILPAFFLLLLATRNTFIIKKI